MTGLTELLRRHLVSDAPPLSRAERWRSTLAVYRFESPGNTGHGA